VSDRKWVGQVSLARAIVTMLAVAAVLAPTSTPALAGPFGSVTEFTTGLRPGAVPATIAAGADGNVWFNVQECAVSFTLGPTPCPSIDRITPTGSITDVANQEGAALVLGPDGNIWFPGERGEISQITPSGAVTKFPGPSGATLVVGPDGNIWFPTAGSAPGPFVAIGRMTTTGRFLGAFPLHPEIPGTLPTIFQMAAGRDGNVWMASNREIFRMTPGGVDTFFNGRPGRVIAPLGITSGPDGNVWFTDQACTQGSIPKTLGATACAIGRITPAGEITEFTAGLAPSAVPSAITAGPDGNLWFTDRRCTSSAAHPACMIGRITPAGVISESSEGLSPGSQPFAIASGPDGHIWFTNIACHEFRGQCAIGRISTTATAGASLKVPKLKGKSLAAAKKLLAQAHLKLGNVKVARHHKHHLRVVSQSVKPGTTRRSGTKVNLQLG
jgi:streptogramin lyase